MKIEILTLPLSTRSPYILTAAVSFTEKEPARVKSQEKKLILIIIFVIL